MKHTKKFIVALVAVVAALALCVPSMAFADGTGTITVENATYGKEYKAYKIFDATYSATDTTKVSYTVDAAHKNLVSTTLFNVSTAADSNGNYSVSKKTDASDADIIAWVKDNYSSFDSTGTAGVFNDKNAAVTFSDMPYGYYYITSTLGTAIAIDTSNPHATVQDKNASEPTTPTKKVVSVDGTPVNGTTADAHVGSVVEFKIEGNATNYTTTVNGDDVSITENTQYVVEDEFKNMTIGGSYTVKVNGEAITNYTAVISDNKITFTIPLVDSTGKHLYQAKAENSAHIPVEIIYSATITEAAAGEPAQNEVGDTTVKVYTYAFQVYKVDENDAALAGAQFELWYNGEALKFTDNGDGTYTYNAEGSVTTLDMTTNTKIVVKGLDKNWSYTLKEIKVPDGYNQAEDKTIAGSSLTKVEENMDTSATTTALYQEKVTNQSGSVLPSTGGIGTTIFYVIGAILVIGAGVVLITKRRMASARKEEELF